MHVNKTRIAALSMGLVCWVSPAQAQTASDYTQGVSVNGATATVYLKSNVNSTWVDVHYTVSGGGQQNFRMTYNNGTARFEQSLAIAKGDVIAYWFTYSKDVLAYNTPEYTYAVGEDAVIAPIFSPAAGTYSSAQNVALSSTTSGASIHYTTDGTPPTNLSPIYTGLIPISSSTTIRAIATKNGMADSTAASATYTINGGCAFTNGVEVSGTTATIWFKSPLSISYVDVRYTISGSVAQIVRMSRNSILDRYESPVTVAPGNVISYTFTYAINSSAFSYTVAGDLVTITRQPIAQNVVEGQTATFSVVATGAGPLSYQWYRSDPGSSTFTAVSGATSDTYQTAALTVAADNKAHYRVQVTDTSNNQHVDSTAALLTVTSGNNAHHPDFGPNVFVFQSTDEGIQQKLDAVYQAQKGLVQIGPGNQNDPQGSPTSEMGDGRYAFLFKPGNYNLDVKVGFYTHVLGLGGSPDSVSITGAVRTQDELIHFPADPRGWNAGPGACDNFWRACENLAVTPTLGFIAYPEDNSAGMDLTSVAANTWAVSQASPLRRVHIQGDLRLWDHGWSSGGFMADSKVDAKIFSGSQQQWITRNSSYGSWQHGLWNMVFVGCSGPVPKPVWDWFPQAVTTAPTVPTAMREKPFLTWDAENGYSVLVPELRPAGSAGVSWANGSTPGIKISLNEFYIAHPDVDTAQTINDQLNAGKHLLLTPGIYTLTDTIRINNPNTIVYGLGIPTLIAPAGKPGLTIADVDGVKMAGEIILDATVGSTTLVQVGGDAPSGISHAANPTFLYDLVCRVGGARIGNAQTAVVINSQDVVGDNFWIWRADHGAGVSWTQTACDTGVMVNGDNVTVYGLAVEHFSKTQTLWKGNGGKVYFYQSEIPYDAPSQAAYMDGNFNGYASYKVVAPEGAVNFTHEGHGMGVYSYFRDADNIWTDHAFEAPETRGIIFEHLVTRWLNGGANTGITHILNQSGGTATLGDRTDRVMTKGLN